MKNTVKKISTTMILLAFALSNTMTIAGARDLKNLLSFSSTEGYTSDRPVLRGVEPSVLDLYGKISITDRNIPINLSLRDSDVKQVLRMFADKAGLNIIFKANVNGTITMDLVNVPLNSAFNMVLESSDLNYVLEDNTLIITTPGDKTNVAKQPMTVLPVKYVNAAAIAEFLNSNIFGVKRSGLSSVSMVTTNPATNELIIFGSKDNIDIARKIVEQFDKKPITTSFKVNHTTPEAMATMICDLLLPSAGGGSSTGGAAGVMTGAASSSSSGDGIVLGEGTVACTVSGDAGGGEGASALALGSLSVAYYTQLGTVNIVGGSAQQIDMIKEFIETSDKKQPQAYLEFSIIELNEEGSRTFNNSWSFTSKHFNVVSDTEGNTKFSPIHFSGDKYNTEYTKNTPSLVYTISYLLKNGKARTVSNPRILVTNGQESTIDMTSDYVKTVTTQIITTTGTTSSTPTQKQYEIGEDDGIKINVTPFISPDGYVYLNVKPDYAMIKSQIDTLSEDEEAAKNGERDIQATLLQRRNLELKNVRIKDGDTLVIAGMMREYEKRTVNKVPFLSDIPGIGSFFRSSATTQTKDELVILITPKIITDDEENAL